MLVISFVTPFARFWTLLVYLSIKVTRSLSKYFRCGLATDLWYRKISISYCCVSSAYPSYPRPKLFMRRPMEIYAVKSTEPRTRPWRDSSIGRSHVRWWLFDANDIFSRKSTFFRAVYNKTLREDRAAAEWKAAEISILVSATTYPSWKWFRISSVIFTKAISADRPVK